MSTSYTTPSAGRPCIAIHRAAQCTKRAAPNCSVPGVYLTIQESVEESADKGRVVARNALGNAIVCVCVFLSTLLYLIVVPFVLRAISFVSFGLETRIDKFVLYFFFFVVNRQRRMYKINHDCISPET